MTQTTWLQICVTCRRDREAEIVEPRDGQRLYDKLKAQYPSGVIGDTADGTTLRLAESRCFSGCKRACTAAMTAEDKWSFVLCEIDPDRSGEDLVTFAKLYTAADDGMVPWRERPESLRKLVLARIPPLPRQRDEDAHLEAAE